MLERYASAWSQELAGKPGWRQERKWTQEDHFPARCAPSSHNAHERSHLDFPGEGAQGRLWLRVHVCLFNETFWFY